MNAELLVAGLWGVVAVYWLWTRRPAGDSIGSFRHELDVLEHATPMRVPPAHRLASASGALAGFGAVVEQPPVPAGQPDLRGMARDHKQAELRRRRRDILGVLGICALVTLVAAVALRSLAVVGLQVVADLALGSYIALLVGRRSLAARLRGESPARRVPRPARMPSAYDLTGSQDIEPAPATRPRSRPDRQVQEISPWYGAGPSRQAEPQEQDLEDIVLDGYRGEGKDYRGAHALGSPRLSRLRLAAYPEEEPEPYGDFGSYASLALAEAN